MTRSLSQTAALLVLTATVGLAAAADAPDAPAGLAASQGIAPVDTLADGAGVDDLLGYAAAHNPGLRAAWLDWQAAQQKSPQASRLPDPRFQWTEQLESVETRVGPQQRTFMLSQTIPWFGTLSLRGKVADARAAAQGARVEAVLDRVLYRTRKAYHDLAYLQTALAITRDHLDLLTSWEAVARSRYATGNASYADVVKAQVEMGKLTDRVSELAARRAPLVAELNAALGRPAAAPLPRLAVPADAPAVTALDTAALRERLRRENPELLAIGHQAAGYELAGDLAGKQRLPDLTLGVSYIQTGEARMDGVADSGKDPWLASVGVSIPLWQGAYAAAEREAAYGYLASESQRTDHAQALGAALERALFDHADAGRKLGLYADTLLPKARQSLGATRAAYESGQANFLDLIDAERMLLEFELSRAAAARDLAIATAEIERLVSGPVPAAEHSTKER